MRSGIVGFILGAILVLLMLAAIQRLLIRPVVENVSYRFTTYVFNETQFPTGDLDNGRIIRRCLLPVKITIKFYDAHYHEVTQADNPGRYGAVVRIAMVGTDVYRFATLYRTPAKIFWNQTPLSISAQLPSESGLNPAVLQTQQHEIGEMIQDSFAVDDSASSEIAILLAALAETSPDAPPAVERTDARARDAAWWYGLRQQLSLVEHYRYLVDLPKDYTADAHQCWPLILYLHHADDRGDDLQLVRKDGLAGLIDKAQQLPAVVISPQCPSNEGWNTLILSHLLDEVCATYTIDPDRIYVTGASAGGDATWALALAYPERIAAIAPICGDTDPADAARLKNMPIWAFHGLEDPTVPVGETIGMIDAIRQAGGHPHMTLFPNTGHHAWDQTYAMEPLYTWLLAQKRNQPEILTPGVPNFGNPLQK